MRYEYDFGDNNEWHMEGVKNVHGDREGFDAWYVSFIPSSILTISPFH